VNMGPVQHGKKVYLSYAFGASDHHPTVHRCMLNHGQIGVSTVQGAFCLGNEQSRKDHHVHV